MIRCEVTSVALPSPALQPGALYRYHASHYLILDVTGFEVFMAYQRPNDGGRWLQTRTSLFTFSSTWGGMERIA